MKVYAVYRSPPSKNQVTIVPKRLPPSPHSCKRSRSPRRQFAAMNPSTVTSRNSTLNTDSAGQFTPLCMALARARREVDDAGQDRAQADPDELVDIEKRDAKS